MTSLTFNWLLHSHARIYVDLQSIRTSSQALDIRWEWDHQVRISRLQATNFRGWSQVDLHVQGDVVVVGEPRAGRTDLVAALTRVLDPASSRRTPSATDIYQRLQSTNTAVTTTASGGHPSVIELIDELISEQVDDTDPSETTAVVRAPFAEVELTLVDLGTEIEQEIPGIAEPLTEQQIVDDSGNANPTAPLGVRLTYRVTYDPTTDALGHVLYFPAVSNPSSAHFVRVPTAFRLMLPYYFSTALALYSSARKVYSGDF